MERYRSIIDDWDAFRETFNRPQPLTVRVNTLRTDIAAIKAHLEQLGFKLQAYNWLPSLFKVTAGPFAVTKSMAHWLGLLYAQEAAACVPVLALQPEPGQTVLDLSAAPGGKTTQIAALMREQGVLIANEPNGARMQALHANLARLGLTGTAVIRYDGRHLPVDMPTYDRVLVDAPCSGEGNLRRSAKAAQAVRPRRAQALAKLQVALVKIGLSLLTDGGTLVYSTCTFAPEENEAVVDAVLQAAAGTASLEELPGNLPGIPGIVAWADTRYNSQVERCRRIYPHHLDSGGMFIACFRRHGPPPWSQPNRRTAAPWLPTDADLTSRLIDWWTETFAVEPAGFEDLSARQQGDGIWLTRLPEVPSWSGLQAAGLRIARQAGAGWQPTTAGLVHFAAEARRNVVELDVEMLQALLQGRRLPAGERTATNRSVALRWNGMTIGRGTVDRQGLRHNLPQGRAEELSASLLAHQRAGLNADAVPPPPRKFNPNGSA